MRFRVLGPIEVSGESGAIPLGGPKQRAVLAHLIVRANQVVGADALIDLVWGDEPPDAVRSSLQSYISHLRKALGAERLESRPSGYVLHLGPNELDASRFEALVREARGADGDAERVGTLLREALGLWRGPAFADLAGTPALSGEIARLEEVRLQAIEERLAADLAAGRHGDVIGELESLVRERPLRERLWEGLMLALYRSGRQAEALAAFQRARAILADELGVDPSPGLLRLHERILRQDPDLDVQGAPLRGYRLLEQIGEGAFGVVFRGIQPQVGREVAVKSIHSELANQPDFVRRFEREAQLVARLEHPHVVPLYDYWREPGGAYLVMRFLRGGTLEDLLAQGALPVGRIAGILDQVASALAAAHRQDVVHRDVKPGNVLLDDDGNAYLSDFGVALGVGSPEQTTGTMARGTPAYLSPEQIRLESLSPRSDIYSLGIVLFEMLTGTHPFPESSLDVLLERHLRQPLPSARGLRPDLPPTVDAVLARATAKDPGARFAEAQDVASAFRSAIAVPLPEPIPPAGAVRNPYKGLRAFLEADAADFFGREALVRRLTERLAQPGPHSRFLCVIGPSGSGKSSVIRAGLVPALRRGAVDGADRWFVAEVLPGAHPLRELESALLGVAVAPPPSLREELERDEFGLVRAVDLVLPDPQAELLLVVDQLEEVFTLVDDEAERAHVLESLRAAVEAPGSRVRVVATLRADFLDQPLSVRGFGDLLAERSEVITPMTPEQLERAIAGPAEHVGLEVEPGLAARMANDVVDRPGALPLLQYALSVLAEPGGRGLTLDGYRKIGGVSGALARRAEALFHPMNETARHACRQLFLRLVTLGDSTEDTRRRVRRSELVSLADARAMDGVIETFGRHRLLSFDRDPGTREPTVEIAHEALLGEWERFREWVEASREDLKLHARLSSAATEWLRGGRSDEDLLTGSRLAQAEEATASESIALTETERAFVDAGLTRRDTEVEAERVRHAREIHLERRARRRLRGLVAVLAAATLVAATLTAVAVGRSREAERRRIEATIAGLTGGVLSSLEADPQLSLLLALHAVDTSVSIGEPVPAESVEAFHLAVQAARIQYPIDDGDSVVVRGPGGARGLFQVELADLADLALANTDRSLTRNECRRYLGASVCPSLPDRFPGRIPAEPVRPAASTPGTQPLAGTTVTVNYARTNEVVLADVREELERFAEETGIQVQLVGNPDAESWLEEAVAAGNPPDVGFFAAPGGVASLGRAGELMDFGRYLDVDGMRRDQSQYLVSLGTVGSDGSWPADEGATYGAFTDLSMKSLIWYPTPEFEAAGYEVPETWDELIALSDQLRSEGRTPWCLGWLGEPSGWPGTDWIEDLVLAEAGAAAYDRWTSHDLQFDSPTVRRAFERMGEIVFAEGYLSEGTGGALATSLFDAQLPMVSSEPPGCWLHHFPAFGAQFLPADSAGNQTDVFPFPAIDEGTGDALTGGGNMLAAFTDRPEVREVIRFLLGPEFARGMAARDHGFLSANRRYAARGTTSFWQTQAELIDAALASDTFRFDASDLMPVEVGSAAFFEAMMTYLAEGPASLDSILVDLDRAWPEG